MIYRALAAAAVIFASAPAYASYDARLADLMEAFETGEPLMTALSVLEPVSHCRVALMQREVWGDGAEIVSTLTIDLAELNEARGSIVRSDGVGSLPEASVVQFIHRQEDGAAANYEVRLIQYPTSMRQTFESQGQICTETECVLTRPARSIGIIYETTAGHEIADRVLAAFTSLAAECRT